MTTRVDQEHLDAALRRALGGGPTAAAGARTRGGRPGRVLAGVLAALVGVPLLLLPVRAVADRWQAPALLPQEYGTRALDVLLSPGTRVLEATGKPLSAWQREAKAAAPGYAFRRIVVLPPREEIYTSCDARFDAMLAAGALEEVAALRARGLDPHLPAMKALGVPELLRYLAGEIGLEEAAEAARTFTRRYAKRQITWLRGEEARQKIHSYTVEEKYSESKWERCFPKIREFLLTP